MSTYNLSISCVNGDIYGYISDNKPALARFLREYDHEGSSINLVRKDGDKFVEIDFENIYNELGQS